MIDVIKRLDSKKEWMDQIPCVSSNAKFFEVYYEILEKISKPRFV